MYIPTPSANLNSCTIRTDETQKVSVNEDIVKDSFVVFAQQCEADEKRMQPCKIPDSESELICAKQSLKYAICIFVVGFLCTLQCFMQLALIIMN